MPPMPPPTAAVFLTSSAGAALERQHDAVLTDIDAAVEADARVVVHADRPRQTFLGVGGSLTQASAAALGSLSPARRAEVLEALFGTDGARLALSRVHIGSSDFCESSYTYVDDDDVELASFSLEADRHNGVLDLLHDALAVPGASLRIMASPWTAPGWMKDTGRLYDPEARRGGRLLPEHHDTFARYLVRYLRAMAEEGVDIWAISPVNEPQGNDGNWESMEMSPEEQRDFLRVLAPRLHAASLHPHVLIFDQNRAELPDYSRVIYGDPDVEPHVRGAAVHWYNSTFKVYEDVLEAEHARHPDKWIVHSEGCIDNVKGLPACGEDCPDPPCTCETVYPWWQDDAWFWRKEATDWGFYWSEAKEDHPRYAPAFRYARDLVVGLGHWLDGWIDWNVVLDKRGGPNHVRNFCLAPILVDGETDTVYYTPLYWIVTQISRHARPGGVVLETTGDGPSTLHAMAIRNPDDTVAVHVFNEGEQEVRLALDVEGRRTVVTSPAASLLTVVVPR